MDIVVQPMQRLTKYSLLLKAIHKNTENEEDQQSLAVMVSEPQTVSLWKYKLFHMQICLCIKDLAIEITLFLNALKRFFLINSSYNSEEYFNYQI